MKVTTSIHNMKTASQKIGGDTSVLAIHYTKESGVSASIEGRVISDIRGISIPSNLSEQAIIKKLPLFLATSSVRVLEKSNGELQASFFVQGRGGAGPEDQMAAAKSFLKDYLQVSASDFLSEDILEKLIEHDQGFEIVVGEHSGAVRADGGIDYKFENARLILTSNKLKRSDLEHYKEQLSTRKAEILKLSGTIKELKTSLQKKSIEATAKAKELQQTMTELEGSKEELKVLRADQQKAIDERDAATMREKAAIQALELAKKEERKALALAGAAGTLNGDYKTAADAIVKLFG